MGHHFKQQMQQRNEQELIKNMTFNKLPEPRECTSCNEPSGFMSFIEVQERIHTYAEDKKRYEFVDISRYTIFRCTNCNAEVMC
jgi:hypothetical protein